MFKKNLTGIGLVALAALLLAGAASPVDASIAHKSFLRDGSINGSAITGILEGNLDFPEEEGEAGATYRPVGSVGSQGNDGEFLLDTNPLQFNTPGVPASGLDPSYDPKDATYETLFDIYVFDVNNSDALNPSLFRNDLSSISTNDGVLTPTFGIGELTFAWYAGDFTSVVAGGGVEPAEDTDFKQSLVESGADSGDVGLGIFTGTGSFFNVSNRLVNGCFATPCTFANAFFPATWAITDIDGFLKPNSTEFFNFMSTGTVTLLVTGNILEPSGGGYLSLITPINAIPLPPAALLFGTALFGIGALRRWKDKKDMAVTA